MPSMMIATVTGHAAKDPELKQAGRGTVCEISVPVNRGPRDNEQTTWVRISVWGKPGEWAAADVQKGTLLQATGEMGVREYQRGDGTKGYSVEMKADRVYALAGRRDRDELRPQHSERQPPAGAAFNYGAPGQPVLDPPRDLPAYKRTAVDDGLPF